MKTKKNPQPKAPWTRMAGGIKPRTKKPYTTPKLTTIRPRLRTVSKARAKRLREYSKLRKEFLAWKPICIGCAKCFSHFHLASEIHHSRGRVGTLLTDTRFWIPVCRTSHAWLGNHPTKARKLGLLCQPGEWNKPVAP